MKKQRVVFLISLTCTGMNVSIEYCPTTETRWVGIIQSPKPVLQALIVAAGRRSTRWIRALLDNILGYASAGVWQQLTPSHNGRARCCGLVKSWSGRRGAFANRATDMDQCNRGSSHWYYDACTVNLHTRTKVSCHCHGQSKVDEASCTLRGNPGARLNSEAFRIAANCAGVGYNGLDIFSQTA
eukprot:COSAG02_NODE_679_length_18565_cov_57.795245_4_plen_184_part_00